MDISKIKMNQFVKTVKNKKRKKKITNKKVKMLKKIRKKIKIVVVKFFDFIYLKILYNFLNLILF